MAHDYWVPPEERSLPAPDAVGRLLPHWNQPMLPQPMFDGSMQPHGDDDSSHGFTTEVQRQALCLDVVPVIAPTSCSRVEKDPKEPTPTPSVGEHQAFYLKVDGSGGKDVWAVGLIHCRKPIDKKIRYRGRNENLGGLRAMGNPRWCDAHIAEALGLYFASSYARHLPAGGTGGGIIICDRMALLGNLAGKSIVDPVKQRAVDLVKHSLWKLLSVHDYVTFVYKGLYGYGKNWPPDTLATEARNDAWHSNTHLRVPIPLKYGELRFENPLWRPSKTNLKEFLELVTVRRGDACRD